MGRGYPPVHGRDARSDWEQRDPSRVDYIKNKPFGKEKIMTNVIEWDGQKGDREWIDVNGKNFMVKVSDKPMTLEQLNSIKLSFEAVGMVNGISEGETGVTSVTINDGSSKGIPLQLVRYKNAYFVHNAQEDCVLSGITYTKGIWFFCTVYNETNYIYPTSIEHEDKIFEIEILKRIDKEYLPDDLAGGVSSWNDLTDKPFDNLGIITVSEDILPEQYFNLSDGMIILSYKLPLIENETYNVKYNGIEISCNCVKTEQNGIVAYLLGNLSMMGLEGGESLPFVIATTTGMTNIVDTSGNNYIVIGVRGLINKENIQKLESKYLESEWNAICNYGNTLYSGFVTNGGNVNETIDISPIGKYTLVVNGVSYDAYPTIFNDEYMALNVNINPENSSDHTFHIKFYDGYFTFTDRKNNLESYHIQIKESDEFKPLPEKYIPELSHFTMVSSTGKKYKVTIDDTGTFVPTEITE